MADFPDAQRQLSSLGLALVLLGPGQKIVQANPAAEQFFSQSLRRLRGYSLTRLIHFKDSRLIARLQDSETPISARDINVIVAGLGPKRLDITVAPIVDEPGWQLVTLQDASGSEALGSDGGGAEDVVLRAPEILAHEIKNPLSGIKGAAQLLARKLGEKDRALTSLIAEEVDRIARLIDEMQALSSRTVAPVDACNLHEAVRRARAVLDAAGKGTTIREEFDPSLPPVLASRDGLLQVLINLLSNAVEACQNVRGPKVIVRTRFSSGIQLSAATPGAQPVRLPIELRVSDNGPGIDPAMVDHIFEPFVTTKKTGQGLGLALVRKLVRDMNGRIVHERDEAGGWTHFRLHLPLAPDEGPLAPEKVRVAASEKGKAPR